MKLDITDEIRLQRTEIVAQKEHQKQEIVAKWRQVPGLKIFQINLETGMVQEAPMKSTVFLRTILSGHTEEYTRHRIDIQPGHLYTQALNHKNAARKFCKMLGIKFPK